MPLTLPWHFGTGTPYDANFMPQLEEDLNALGQSIPWVTPEQFGALGNGVHDDSTAIKAAIDSLTNGGMVFFGTPSDFYAIGSATAIELPTDRTIFLMGAGRGDYNAKPGTLLRAIEPIFSMISSGLIFFRGHRISNMTLDGAQLAQHNLWMPFVDTACFDHLFLQNATDSNFTLGDPSGANNVQENLVFNVKMNNDGAASGADYPNYNFEFNGSDSSFINLVANGAQVANFYAHHVANNFWNHCHCYGADFGACQFGFLIDTGGQTITNWQCDGSVTSNMELISYGNYVSLGISQFDGVTPAIHVRIADGQGNNFIFANNFYNSAASTDNIVQVGTAGGSGNFYSGNYDGNNGIMLPSRLNAPVLVSQLLTLATADAGAEAVVSDATATTFHSIVAGTGGNTVKVFWDGTNWRIGG